ncbi:MAG: C40 family peptidase [Pseudomonadota bacterium]
MSWGSNMGDRRLTPANDRVAAQHLRGSVKATRFCAGEAWQVVAPVTDLCRSPDGPRDRQLLFGAGFTVYEKRDGWFFGQAELDGYVGYARADHFRAPLPPSHWVAVRATHIYSKPDIKSAEFMSLSFSSALTGTPVAKGFLALEGGGFVPAQHVTGAPSEDADPVDVAERFHGAPYLWGGNSAFGIDCSGLVQLAFGACGIYLPPDSDMQESAGRPVSIEDLRRGDLVFWPGHVAIVRDGSSLVHANAFHMAVEIEPIDDAIRRIPDAVSGCQRVLDF